MNLNLCFGVIVGFLSQWLPPKSSQWKRVKLEVPGDQYCMFLYIKRIYTHTRTAASSAVELCNLLNDRLT